MPVSLKSTHQHPSVCGFVNTCHHTRSGVVIFLLLLCCLKLSPSESHISKTVSQEICPSNGKSCHIAADGRRPCKGARCCQVFAFWLKSTHQQPSVCGFVNTSHFTSLATRSYHSTTKERLNRRTRSTPAGNGHLEPSRPRLVPPRPKVCARHVREPSRFPKNASRMACLDVCGLERCPWNVIWHAQDRTKGTRNIAGGTTSTLQR